MRLILGAQAKVTTEMLYLETSEIPVKNVISVRRLVYLHTILKRHDDEITKKVYVAMKENPLKYDWIELISTDKELFPNDTKEDEDMIKLMMNSKLLWRNLSKTLLSKNWIKKRNHTANSKKSVTNILTNLKHILQVKGSQIAWYQHYST